jgi:hypothetical protein
LREETLARKQMEAEERAELAAIEESERAALQLERELAIAAIENDRGEPPRPLSAEEFEGDERVVPVRRARSIRVIDSRPSPDIGTFL